MTSKNNLLVTNYFHPETISKLDKLYRTHHLWEYPASEKLNLIRKLEGKCHAVATASWACDDLIYNLNSLELISCFGVGVDAIDFEKTNDLNIKVTNTPDVLNDSVADIALALILATTRSIVTADKFVRSKNWEKGPLTFGHSLAGKTLGIIGLGRIGEEIVQRALPFKLEIAYHNRSPKDLPYTYYPTIEELAQNSDILLCMLPGGEKTLNMINGAVFEKLGPNGVFINVGRGSSVDEDALVSALQTNQIFSAGLDVYANEPNVPAALLGMDNVVLLPHIGSATVETRREMGNVVIANLEAYFENKPLLTVVNHS
ncbi:MAG: hydroxyacid dehydrogenase [SAR86 cluster bacterium]|uniref:Hydroxyacid dehydrogenase n=1 Tax=SAR86 cluster bacterium TaxID=2030880 RepID=A0A2A5ASM8_9GAMM|nr:MAG: hydroxyacid dehydrogenase [SAR86 cluster bacterium]